MRIGLTGGMGCGKTAAVRVFSELGFSTAETDVLVRNLLDADPEVIAALRERFGPAIAPEGGPVDRKALAATVFADAAALAWLEALLHPRVRAAWTALVDAKPQRVWVVEIPLLFEKNLEKHFDFSVCVTASPAVQLARLAGRGFRADEAKARIDRQMRLSEKVDRADFVITNDGSLAFLRRQIGLLAQKLLPS